MSDKIFIPLGQTTPTSLLVGMELMCGHQQEDIMEVRGSRLEETEHIVGNLLRDPESIYYCFKMKTFKIQQV